MTKSLKIQVYDVIEASVRSDWKGRWFDIFMMALIITNVIAVIIETIPGLDPEHHSFLQAFDTLSVIIFSIEYVSRVWVCTENKEEGFEHPVMGRIKHMLTPLALIDLIAIAPFYLAFFVSVDLRFMRIFRLLRLLKLTRYSPAIETFAAVLKSQRRPLGAALLVMMMLLIFASSVVFMFEREAQTEAFASIPHAMWWGLATLTTVGYGDVTPITAGGKIFGAFIMVMGIAMFALPAGILTSGFTREIKKRDFTVTWQLVAGVPLFSKLDALRISEIAGLLHPKLVPARYVIVKRGEYADSMYFIVTGEVDVDVHPEHRMLSNGDFFGEIALLKDCARTATITTRTECQLLYLDAHDFHRLLDASPELRAPIEKAMEQRLAELESLGETH
ncbi:MAG: ion transporter [Rhodospirillaceae bacterium]|nr:ion transporter [Rhodospirillaceae bacterium]MBL6930277.1 ion transporter [Rhodospirillales bacterium]MBL6941807.1 ion transporter [Rhodospirillales bacterium]